MAKTYKNLKELQRKGLWETHLPLLPGYVIRTLRPLRVHAAPTLAGQLRCQFR